MWTVAQANLIPIVIALLIGVIAGWWIFRSARSSAASSRSTEPAPSVGKPAPPQRRDGHEGNAITDSAAAATADVAGEILGVDAHPDIPGPNGPPDNLQMLKGVGPKLASQLNGFGITRFDQLAALNANEVAILDDKLGAFRGRLTRDRVIEQAYYLARDDRDGFEAKFGKLGA
jgi:predicted flap endonuclease-1-like 5' DNA nuclease